MTDDRPSETQKPRGNPLHDLGDRAHRPSPPPRATGLAKSVLPPSRKYTLLLGSLVLLGLLYPALDFGVGGRAAWTVSTWMVLLGAVRACQRHPLEMYLARWMVAVLVGTAAVRLLVESSTLYFVVLSLHVVFFAWTMRVILWDVLTSRRVTYDTIYGASALYVMLGVAGAFVFELLHEVDPAAFVDVNGVALRSGDGSIGNFLYLSFVTLTTLGYGDITPESSLARLMTSGEAVVGQLYLTILVARLVGLHIGGSSTRGSHH